MVKNVRIFLDLTQKTYFMRCCVTTPFIGSATIAHISERFFEVADRFDSCLTVELLQKHLLTRKGNRFNYGIGKDYLRSQNLETMYLSVSGVSIIKYDTAQKYNDFVCPAPYLYTVNHLEAIDINSSDDWENAQQMCQIDSLRKIIT